MYKLKLLSLTILGIVGFSLLGCNKNEMQISRKKPKAELAITELSQSLKSELKRSIQAGGVESGIETCALKAPDIAAKVSMKHQLQIKRISHKNRNPQNKPSREELSGLDFFLNLEKENRLSSQDRISKDITYNDTSYTLYMAPILTQNQCLVCHGENIAPSIKENIQRHYPNDKATHFKEGQLRGAFSVRIAKQKSIDNRQPLFLTEELAYEHKKRMMKQLQRLEQILSLVADENYAEALTILPKQMGSGTFRQQLTENNPGFLPMSESVHTGMNAIKSGLKKESMPETVKAVSKTLQSCNVCHQIYKHQIRNE